MKYALITFRMYFTGQKPFLVDTDHEQAHTATQSHTLIDRMDCGLSFFAKYSFKAKLKVVKHNDGCAVEQD